MDTDRTNTEHIIEHSYQQFTNMPIHSQDSVDHIKRPISSYASNSDTDNASTTESPINTTTTPKEKQNHQKNNSIFTKKLLEFQTKKKKGKCKNNTQYTPYTN
ncbi:hypothetical protein QTP88_021970 [Uroleucon formosanum]